MRAWTFNRRGPAASVLSLSTDLPAPTPSTLKPDQVLIRVTHVGLSIFHALIPFLPHLTSAPWIPEFDFAGVVEASGGGEATSLLNAGTEVFGGVDPPWVLRHGGVLAEYVVLPAGMVVRRPEGVKAEEASGLASYGCAAVQMGEKVGLGRGGKVLVTAAASAQGLLMVMVARAMVGKEGWVVGTCSEASDELVRRVGADEVSLTWATGWWGWRGLIDGRLLTTRSILRRPTTSYSTTTRGPSMRSSTSPAMITSYTIDPCPI